MGYWSRRTGILIPACSVGWRFLPRLQWLLFACTCLVICSCRGDLPLCVPSWSMYLWGRLGFWALILNEMEAESTQALPPVCKYRAKFISFSYPMRIMGCCEMSRILAFLVPCYKILYQGPVECRLVMLAMQKLTLFWSYPTWSWVLVQGQISLENYRNCFFLQTCL